MSRAVVFDEYGGPDVLHVVDGPLPEPSTGQVRVHVRAAGVQPFDSLFRRGDAKAYMPATFPQRLGNEFAGVVDAVGPEVAGVRIGDEVVGWAALSSYAEHVVVASTDLVPKPAELPWAQAGTLSASGQTAMTVLDELLVGAGDTVLIHAAAGGVGSFAVQIARAAGATVIGTARASNHDYLRSLGAIPVAYGDGLVERVRAAAPRVDAAFDASGTVEALEASIALVADQTRVATIVYQPAAQALGIRHVGAQRSAERLGRLTELYRAGHLRVEIQQTYPLEQAAQAHRDIDTGHVRGKIVLTT